MRTEKGYFSAQSVGSHEDRVLGFCFLLFLSCSRERYSHKKETPLTSKMKEKKTEEGQRRVLAGVART